MKKETKQGKYYALWYRLSLRGEICEEWMDYDVFLEWATKAQGNKDGRFKRVGKGYASPETIKFVGDNDKAEAIVKSGTIYAAWNKYKGSGGLCREWSKFENFYKWASKEMEAGDGRFVKASGVQASPETVKFMPSVITKTKAGTVYYKWMNLVDGERICDEWKDYQIFAKWWDENYEDGCKFAFNGYKAAPDNSSFTPKSANPRYVKAGSIYSAWRRLQSSLTICDEWKEYRNFYDWYSPRFKNGHVLITLGQRACPEKTKVVLKRNRIDDPIKAGNSIMDRELNLCPEWESSILNFEKWYSENIIDDLTPAFNGGYASPETYVPYVEGEGECWDAWVDTVKESEEKRIPWKQEDLEWEGFKRNWEENEGVGY